MPDLYAPARAELRKVDFLKRIRHFRGIGVGSKALDVRLDLTPVQIIENKGPAALKKDAGIMKAAMEELDKDLEEHIEGWKKEHIEVKKLIKYVRYYLDFWKWVDEKVNGKETKWEFPSTAWLSWNRKFSRHTIRDVLKETDKKIVHARKVLRTEYGIEL